MNARGDKITARLVAETLAESAGTAPADNDAALAKARRASGRLEDKVTAYFAALSGANNAEKAVLRLKRFLLALSGVAVLLAFVAGAATAQTAFGTEDGTLVNFFWVLGSILGLNTLMLLIWLGMILLAPADAGENGLGAALMWAWRHLSERLARSGSSVAAARAVADRLGHARQWVISALSHAVWTGFLLGALAMTLLLLSTQQYVFVWETTILSAETYTALTHGLAALPAWLGVAVPDAAMIAAAQWRDSGVPPATGQATWSAFLIASIAIYGLAPRLIALAVTTTLAHRKGWGRPLDLSQPAFARVVPYLAPVVESTAIVAGTEETAHPVPATRAAPRHELPPPPAGIVALVGWEIDARRLAWPPAADSVRDLDIVDGAAALDTVTAALDDIGDLARLVVVADLCETPDRGVLAGMRRLHEAAEGRMALLLTGAAALRRRLNAPDAADRLADWVSAGHQAGLPLAAIVEIDLGLSDPDAEARFRRLLGIET